MKKAGYFCMLMIVSMLFTYFPTGPIRAESAAPAIYEAENAVVSDANVYSGIYASNGKYVGFINNADSYVQFNVSVTESGNYSMSIGYANGTGAVSTHALSVNGEQATVVSYPATGAWSSGAAGSIQTAVVNVRLNTGANTIRLTKASSYAELDYIALSPSSAVKPVQTITVSSLKNQTEMAIGGSLQCMATVTPSDAVDTSVTWSVSNTDNSPTSSASISSAGLLTALKEGEVKVTATANDGSGVTSALAISIKGNHFAVDLSNLYRPVTHAASGSLYGLADEGRPDDSLIGPTKPFMFTQMAPNGGQLPNGEKLPVGDALKVAPIAARNGAKVTIRMPDIYPDFPYKWVSWSDWYGKVDTMVKSTNTSGVKNIYGYELWNEPDWTWDAAKAGDFPTGWAQTYKRVRTQDGSTPIIGPSISIYNHAWLLDFMTKAKENNVLPEIISWHELGDYDGTSVPWTIQSHIDDFRQIENDLGVPHRPISINEYTTIPEEAVPGSSIRYIAGFERGGVESATAAFWFRPGRLSNLVTESKEPNGGWWLYKWYGDMSGQMAMTTPAFTTMLGMDGIASVDNSKQAAYAIFGGSEGKGLITLKGFQALPSFSGKAHVKAEATPWYGVDTAVSQAIDLFEGDFTIVNGQITVPIDDMDKTWGYRLTITPSGDNTSRYEAERATLIQSTVQAGNSASNNGYVGPLAEDNSSIEFPIQVPAAGNYSVQIRYANGSAAAKQLVSVNGVSSGTINYPSTGGWMSLNKTGVAQINVNLHSGENKLRLTKEQNAVELDDIQLTPVTNQFELRLEAEQATLNDALVFGSSYASDQRYVGYINNADSYVQFSSDVPAAGEYDVEVGYANGTSSTSTHLLSVNGGASTTVSFPVTGNWTNSVPNFGGRKTIQTKVTLKKGENIIRFTKNTGYAELDYMILSKTIDMTPPVTQASTVPVTPDGLMGWYMHPVTVQLTATDDLSGVAVTEYSLDNGATWQPYSSPIVVNQNGASSVSYRSRDLAGNVEALNNYGIHLDSTAPSIQVAGLSSGGSYKDSEAISVTATVYDDISGVNGTQTMVTLDANDIIQGNLIPLYTLPLGTHTVQVSAADVAGNRSVQTVTFTTTTDSDTLKSLIQRFVSNGWIDNAGTANSLVSKLDGQNVQSFINEVKAQRGKHISTEAATYLLRDANSLLK